jgi:hypothetical protein
MKGPKPWGMPIVRRLGPLVPPVVSAAWQAMQPPLPEKISLPRPGSPPAATFGPGAPAAAGRGGPPGVEPTIDRRKATTLAACCEEKLCGGIDVPGIPA